MEVLASVGIIAVVGMALLQIASNNSTLIQHILNRKTIHDTVSLLAQDIQKTDNKLEREPYEFLRSRYEIKNDDVRKALKAEKYAFYFDGERKYELFKEFQLQTDEEAPSIIPLNIGRYRVNNGEINARWHRITLRQ